MKPIAILIVILATTSAVVAAQFYRWVDEKGNVEYRDTPPPKEAKKVEQRRMGGNTIQTSTTSYDVQQAAKNYPVTLWSYDCGEPCNNARALLERRGVPYTQKDPREDLKGFERMTGSTGVPVLYVGQSRLIGFLDIDWEKALDAAGYPKTAAAAGGKPAAKPPAKPAAEETPAAKAAPPAGKPATAATDRSVPYPPGQGAAK